MPQLRGFKRSLSCQAVWRYLLGSASGASLGLVLALLLASLAAQGLAGWDLAWLQGRWGQTAAAFAGAWLAVLCTWALARGVQHGLRLLLGSDLAARWLLAPQELPVGVLTAALGGAYLLRQNTVYLHSNYAHPEPTQVLQPTPARAHAALSNGGRALRDLA